MKETMDIIHAVIKGKLRDTLERFISTKKKNRKSD
jgi:hypothetical protein